MNNLIIYDDNSVLWAAFSLFSLPIPLGDLAKMSLVAPPVPPIRSQLIALDWYQKYTEMKTRG